MPERRRGRRGEACRGARAIMKKTYVRPLDLASGAVDLSHGGGGRAMLQLIGEVFGCGRCGAQLEVSSAEPLELEPFSRIEQEEEDFV